MVILCVSEKKLFTPVVAVCSPMLDILNMNFIRDGGIIKCKFQWENIYQDSFIT